MGLDNSLKVKVIGGEFEDIILFITRIFQCYGLKTMIKDHTYDHRFYPVFPHTDDISPLNHTIDYRGIRYTFGESIEDKEINDIDIYFLLYDLTDPVDDNKTIYVINESKRFLDYLEKIKAAGSSIIIVRNYTGVEDKNISRISDLVNSEDILALPYNIKDHKYGILAWNNDNFRFTGISKEFQRVLLCIFRYIIRDTDTKHLHKAYHKASKGGM